MIQCRDHITTLTLPLSTPVSHCWLKPSFSFRMVVKGHVNAELQNYNAITILNMIVSGIIVQSGKIQNHVLPPSAQWPLRREPFVSF